MSRPPAKTGAFGTPVAAAPASASAKKPILSSKVLGMKFMQRHAETQLRKTLETEKSEVEKAQQWTAPVTPSRDASASPPAASASPFSPHFGLSPFGAPAASAAMIAAAAPRSRVFLDEQDTSATPSLPASALSEVGGSAAAAVAAAAAAPLPSFVPGRRSYGSFNPKIDALVAEAKELTSASAQGEKQARRETRDSVSDERMADVYVGMRGKPIHHGQVGGQQSGGGGGHKHPRNDREGGGGPQKKHKSTHGSAKQKGPKTAKH